MIRLSHFALFGLIWLLASCATGTIAQLKDVKVDLEDENIEGGLDKAMQNYQLYLDKTPESDMTPEAMQRLADLKIKKEFDFTDKRITVGSETETEPVIQAKPSGAGAEPQSAGTREAIGLYKKLLADYPSYEHNDHSLYQLARIYEEFGDIEDAMGMMGLLTKNYPRSRYIDEIHFRMGERFYALRQFAQAKQAYQAIVDIGAKSPYYELALYKLGWTLYKQESYEDGLRQFFALFDHKIAKGSDLDYPKDAFDQKRIEDTYRVMSLSFSYLGGADAVAEYFNKYGKRSYESNSYKKLGEYYLEMRRYSDAASTFKAYAKNNPFHKLSPYFDMWAIDSYRKGGFSMQVVDANKEFVASYGLKSAYWTRFDIASFGEVSGYIKNSMRELAHLYHAQYQDKNNAKSKNESFIEAVKWYREFINSFPKDADASSVHYQLAELLLENSSYEQAAVEFEHVAYDYPAHKQSPDAGYAAVYSLRKNLAVAAQDQGNRAKHDVIRSSLKFADAFPKNEKAAVVMGAAVDDIYGLKEYAVAAATAKKLLTRYPADRAIRRSGWLVFAHSSFELGKFGDAEEGYRAVLGETAEKDASRAGLIENFAASLYKQGEQANNNGNYSLAATYFLMVGTAAPTALIRPVADFDGIAALIKSKDLGAAAKAVRSYRANYPGQPKLLELNKKLAMAYREAGQQQLAAEEYELLATEAQDAKFQRASLELAADLYYQAKNLDKAYQIHRRYVNTFPKPLEYALEMRNKIAAYLKTRSDMGAYLSELKKIMEDDAKGGAERTDRTRLLGAKAALDIAELSIKPYSQIKLENPYEENLRKKQAAMMTAKTQLEKLFDYETDTVISAATYYLAEMYYDFSRSIMKSERPYGLNEQEKEQYELSIEEQAYPFEEKAIQVHQKNLELMTRGIYNSWIEKSIEKLAKIVPARYAKYEESSGYIKTLDNYDYAALIDPKRSGATSAARVVPARKLTSDQKKDVETVFSEAMQSLTLAQFEKAIKLLNKATAKLPDNPVPYINLALIHGKLQSFAQAEESLKRAVKIDPENPVVNNELALLYRKTARFSLARKIYEKILERYPNFTMARKNLGVLCDLYMKDYSCALKHYEIYSGLMPEDEMIKKWITGLPKG